MRFPSTPDIFAAIMLGASLPTSAAVTVNSHTFSGVTNGAIDTSGTADWGYVSVAGVSSGGVSGLFDSNLGGAGLSYNNTDFGSITRNDGTILTTVKASPTVGNVTLTEGTSGTNTVDAQSNSTGFTFDGSAAFGSYGNFAPTEQDVWRMTFNDLGVGQFAIRIYMGHTNTNRSFDMDISFDGGASTALTTTSGALSTFGSTVPASGGLGFAYDIDVTTTSATDDLTLTLGGIGGSSGGAFLSGYTVTAIPEPAASMLAGLAGICLLARRRR